MKEKLTTYFNRLFHSWKYLAGNTEGITEEMIAREEKDFKENYANLRKLTKNEDFLVDMYLQECADHNRDNISHYKVDKVIAILKETPEFAWYITIYKDAYEMVSDVKGFRVNNSVEELQKMFDLLKEVLK